jgi:hypothetical protein
MSAKGQTRTIRASPPHICFTQPGRFGAPAELSEKGQKRPIHLFG